MDGGDDSLAILGELFEQEYDLEGSRRVEAGCGLIEKDDAWVGNQFHTD